MKTTVVRVAFLLEQDAYGEWVVNRVEAVLAQVCCAGCGGRFRVLPSDILPRKLYGLAVIEHLLAAYAEGGQGLRGVVWAVAGERTPAFTTLRAWIEGLGAYALGRALGEVPGSRPHTALVQETEARVPESRDVAVPAVDERRYRAQARRERLGAVAHLLAVAAQATGVSSPLALASWCALALGWGLTSPLLFRTGLPRTRLEQVGVKSRARSPPV